MSHKQHVADLLFNNHIIQVSSGIGKFTYTTLVYNENSYHRIAVYVIVLGYAP